jgi:hypothetical protein
MKFGIWVLQRLFPKFEEERMAYRRLVHYTEAHCEDLLRQLRNGHDKEAVSEIIPRE